MGAEGSFESLLSIRDTKYCHPKDSNIISSERCTFIYFNCLFNIVLFEKQCSRNWLYYCNHI